MCSNAESEEKKLSQYSNGEKNPNQKKNTHNSQNPNYIGPERLSYDSCYTMHFQRYINIDHTFTMQLRVNKECISTDVFPFFLIFKKLLSHWTSRPHLSFSFMKDTPIQRFVTSSMTGKFFSC